MFRLFPLWCGIYRTFFMYFIKNVSLFDTDFYYSVCKYQTRTYLCCMKPKAFHIGNKIQHNEGEDSVLEFYFMDTIQNETNWFTGEDDSMLGQIIDKVNEIKPNIIRQCIDSWGGSAPVGLGVYNYFSDKKSHKAKRVETKILNNCASIASVMACAGDKGYITMPRNGIMVIHRASGSASGTSDELREAADVIDVYTENVLDVYVQNNRKGKTRDEIFNLIKDGDYWMTGAQAKEMGFVDDTYNDDSVTITNSIKLAKESYGEVPEHIMNMVEMEEEKPFFKNLINKIKMEVQAVMDSFKADLKNSTVPADIQNNIFMALEKPLTNILNAILKEKDLAFESVTNKVTEVTNNFNEVINGIKETITELTNKIGEQETQIAAQKETIEAQNKLTGNLTNDIRRIQGKPSAAAGNEDVAENNKKTFAGRMKFTGGEAE